MFATKRGVFTCRAKHTYNGPQPLNRYYYTG